MIEKIDYIGMIINSKYELDEKVKYFIPSPLGEEYSPIKRVYFTIDNDEKGELVPTYISKEEYEANKDDDYCHTTLNYGEFDFDKSVWENHFYGQFYHSNPPIESLMINSLLEAIGKLESHKAKVLCLNLINRINESYTFLNSILEDIWEEYNNIQKFVASHFLEFIKTIYPNIKEEIIKIFPELFEKKQDVKQPKLENATQYKSDIFRNQEAENWFNNLLEELDVSDGGRGFGAVIAAIFRDNDCKKHILKGNLIQRKYIEYLNDKFNKKMNTTKLSNSDNYANEIEKHIKNYINSLSE